MTLNGTIRRSLLRATVVAAALAALSTPAVAQWPDKPIRLVVSSSAGGGLDVVARALSERMARALGQPIVIDNKGGAGGNIAAQTVARAPADGYTLLFTGNNFTVNLSLFAEPPYRLDDFVGVVELTRGPSVIIAAKNAPFKNLRDLISRAKAAPSSIAYGSPGIGTSSHIAFELLQRDTGTTFNHAPYKGGGPVVTDAVAGQIPVATATLAAAMPFIKADRVQALAVTSSERWPSLPDVPTVAEVLGIPYSYVTWLGILAPKGTPPAVIATINDALNKILQERDVQAELEKLGFSAVTGTAASFQEMLDADFASSRALIQRAKLRAE